VTITTLNLIHKYGETREIQILRIDHDGFIIRWGFQEFTFHVQRNQLVRVRGNRVTKKFDWKASNIDELRVFHNRWCKAKHEK
jgi:hypothetical protein